MIDTSPNLATLRQPYSITHSFRFSNDMQLRSPEIKAIDRPVYVCQGSSWINLECVSKI